MLIRWANIDERKSYGYIDGFNEYEVLIAVDRMTNTVLGILGFSRKFKKIKDFLLLDKSRKEAVEERLRRCAKNQLEPKGNSFHYRYPKYAFESLEENCGACKNMPMPEGMDDLATLEHSWVIVEAKAQGNLFGKCAVGSKIHSIDLMDMTFEDMSNFMSDIQRVAAVLKQVTGAVKINYEIHGNSGPHLHCHLFPRYLDDDFPSAPIDYRITEPSPYESDEEYNWFIKEMRKGLGVD
jgi:diadenosine tetraphosphate (Ap4A) HIT family hydrolase